MDHRLAPLGEHVVLAMRRFYNHRIEATWVLAQRIEKGSIVQAHRATADR